jgi:hypothetical protein
VQSRCLQASQDFWAGSKGRKERAWPHDPDGGQNTTATGKGRRRL